MWIACILLLCDSDVFSLVWNTYLLDIYGYSSCYVVGWEKSGDPLAALGEQTSKAMNLADGQLCSPNS